MSWDNIFAPILAQSEEDDLYLIDQHAAHERVLYDLLKKDLSTGELPVQEIIPQTYELDTSRQPCWRNH